MEIHILLAGVEIGPFSENQVRRHLADGLVSPSDPAKVEGTDKWEAVDIVLANLPKLAPKPAPAPIVEPSPLIQRAPRAILRSSNTAPPPLKPTPPPAAPPPPEPVPPVEPPSAATTDQKTRRKPAKIVLQPINPIQPGPLPTPIRAIKRTTETTASPVPTNPTDTAPKKMIAVKALQPTHPASAQQKAGNEIQPEKKSPPPLPAAKPAPTAKTTLTASDIAIAKAHFDPPPIEEREEILVPTQVSRRLPRSFYYFIGAGVLAVLVIGAGIYWVMNRGADSSQANAAPPPSADEIILASHPITADGFTKQGVVRQARGDIDGAVSDYDQAISLESNNVQALYQRGLARETKNDWNGALADFNQALSLDPRHAESYSNRGFVKQTLGDLDGAIADYTQALFINPKIAAAFYNRGLIKSQRGDLDGALADYSGAIEINSKIPLVYFNRGLIRAQKGDLDGAISDYNRTLELDPKMSAALYKRGNAKNTEGNVDGAIADYSQSIELNPNNADAYGYRGKARQDKGDLDGALDDYNKALAINPRIAGIWFNSGLVRLDKGDLDGAITDFSHTLELDPKDAQSYCNRGLAKFGKGDFDGSLVDLKTYCQLTPRDPETDSARLYLWLISTQENPQGHADKDLATAMTVDWNSPPDSLATKIAKFLLGHASEGDMLSIANDLTQDSSARTKAWYFAGMKRLITGEKDLAIDYLQKALTTGKPDSCEYMFAQQKLKDLGVTPGAAPDPPTAVPQ